MSFEQIGFKWNQRRDLREAMVSSFFRILKSNNSFTPKSFVNSSHRFIASVELDCRGITFFQMCEEQCLKELESFPVALFPKNIRVFYAGITTRKLKNDQFC
jgi:hypothetical protein